MPSFVVFHPKTKCVMTKMYIKNYFVVVGACPKINPLPAYECSKRRSKKTCWSVGQKDVDCPSPDGLGYGLCCFDGCSNSCQYKSTPSHGKSYDDLL